MIMVSDRQRTAFAIAAELRRFEPTVWVTSPLPLADGANLRFQVRNEDREAVLAKLSSWGYSIRPAGGVPRVTFSGFAPATMYEIAIPQERQPIPRDDIRKIPQDEVVSRELKEYRRLHGLR